MQGILQARNLTIGYGKKVIGSGININLYAGEIIALLGPNGSGKTTLFKHLLGLIAPIKGSIFLNQKPLSTWCRRDIASWMGYVPQAAESHFSFSVLDMVLMGRAPHIRAFSSPSPQDHALAQAIIEELGIGHLCQRYFNEISGGERQLTLLARALVQQPRILILDEPTASLDFANQIRVLEQIKQLRTRGIAVLYCTHQPEHALQIADRIALFKQGQLHKVGNTQDIGTLENLAWLYDVSQQQVQSQLNIGNIA